MRLSMGDATMRPSHTKMNLEIDESPASLAREKLDTKSRLGNRRAPPTWQERIPMVLGDSQWAMPLWEFPIGKTTTERSDLEIDASLWG